MAALHQLRIAPMLSSVLPKFSAKAFASSLPPVSLYVQSRALSHPTWSSLGIAIPSALQIIPGLLGDIWEGILRAVPKKKTSHMKRRHRQMAGKAIKDVTNLNKCPACGGIKKMHTLCLDCMHKIEGALPSIDIPKESR